METLLPIFTGNFTFRWQDLFDIVLLSIIFYRILLLIRGTRTIPMLMGFVLLLALYLVSLILNLEATQLLLDNLGQSLVLYWLYCFRRIFVTDWHKLGFSLFSVKTVSKKEIW